MERVYLVGFMGSGKSTTGSRVAERLGLPFVDLDDLIEKQDGRKIQEIFRESGEIRFREIESEVLGRVSRTSPRVVALGGGTYTDPANRAVVDGTGVAVYLDTAFRTILERVPVDGTRPLFSSRERIRELYEERLPSYRMAPVRVTTDGLEPDEIAGRVVLALQARSTPLQAEMGWPDSEP